MRIERIDLWHVDAPLPAPFHPAWIPGFIQTGNRFTLVRMTTTSGLEGWSAAPSMGKERAGLGALLGPYLLGERADDLPSIQQRIREMGYLGWRCGWLEPACWDLIGKAANKPVYELLGGEGGSVRLYASTGEPKPARERAAEVQARVDEGFEVVKLRVHAQTLAEDIAHVRETRELVGDAVGLGVDANQAWRVAVIRHTPRWTLERATEFCKAAADHGLTWVEEPLPMDAYDELAELCRRTQVAITGGELNNSGLPELSLMLQRGCYDVYQPDAVMTGGIASTVEFVRRVHAAGSRYSPHTWTNGIGFAINLQVFAASPFRASERLEYPCAPPGWTVRARDALLVEPFTAERGTLKLPTRPGLGFEIDRRALRRHGRRFFVATPVRVAVSAVLDKGLHTAKALGATRDQRMADRSRELDDELAEHTPTELGIAYARELSPELEPRAPVSDDADREPESDAVNAEASKPAVSDPRRAGASTRRRP